MRRAVAQGVEPRSAYLDVGIRQRRDVGQLRDVLVVAGLHLSDTSHVIDHYRGVAVLRGHFLMADAPTGCVMGHIA